MLTIDNPKTFDWAGMSLADCCEGNAMDSHYTLKLYHLIRGKLEEKSDLNEGKLMKLVDKVIMPSVEEFAEMEFLGLDVDVDILEEVGRQLNDSNMDLEDALYSYPEVDKRDNIVSNNDLQQILYLREDGFGLFPPDFTDKGAPSVAAPTIKLLLELIEDELEQRGTSGKVGQ